MKENNPELVEKLVKYQLEAKNVLAAAFLPEGYKIETQKQHETDNVKCYTSSTPIPKIKDSLGIAKVRKSNEKLKNETKEIKELSDLGMDYTKEIELSKPYELPENYMDIQKELIAIFLKQSTIKQSRYFLNIIKIK